MEEIAVEFVSPKQQEKEDLFILKTIMLKYG